MTAFGPKATSRDVRFGAALETMSGHDALRSRTEPTKAPLDPTHRAHPFLAASGAHTAAMTRRRRPLSLRADSISMSYNAAALWLREQRRKAKGKASEADGFSNVQLTGDLAS